MSNLLDTVYLDIDEVLEELQSYWLENSEYNYNPTAFTRAKTSGANIMCCCPYHVENNPSFGILTDYPYTFQCFGCGKSGNLAQLVAHAVGLPTEAHGEYFILKTFIATSLTEQRPKLNLEDILDKKRLDRRVSLLDQEAEKFAQNRHPYLYSRGYSEVTLKRYEVGYDSTVKAMTLPVRDSRGHVRFIKRRFVERKGFLNVRDLDKKDIIYGLFYITQSKTPITEIDLNESETDTMSCYQAKRPAGAILGRILFKDQVQGLQKAGIKTVNLFFDNDDAGVKCTLQAFELLSHTPIRVNVILYPGCKYGIDTSDEEEVAFKDANNLLTNNMIDGIRKVSYTEWLTMLKI